MTRAGLIQLVYGAVAHRSADAGRPSSVTFGDSFPQGKPMVLIAALRCYPCFTLVPPQRLPSLGGKVAGAVPRKAADG